MPPVLWDNEPWGDLTQAAVKAIEARYREKLRTAKDFWGLTRDDYAYIKIAKCRIPEGVKLIEAYETEHEYILLGDPCDTDDENDPRYHNCDALGCGSADGHIVARYRKPEPPQP